MTDQTIAQSLLDAEHAAHQLVQDLQSIKTKNEMLELSSSELAATRTMLTSIANRLSNAAGAVEALALALHRGNIESLLEQQTDTLSRLDTLSQTEADHHAALTTRNKDALSRLSATMDQVRIANQLLEGQGHIMASLLDTQRTHHESLVGSLDAIHKLGKRSRRTQILTLLIVLLLGAFLGVLFYPNVIALVTP